MSNYFVIGDIHGRLDMLIAALPEWDKDREQLVLLGDYIDYGPNGLGVIREVKNLVDKYGAITLKGNHEYDFVELMLDLKDKHLDNGYWYSNGRKETFKSFLNIKELHVDQFKKYQKQMLNRHQKYISFMDDLPAYHESKAFIFTHSGIDVYASDWRLNEHSMVDGPREEIINANNPYRKILVFGHIRTGVIRGHLNGRSVKALHKMPFLDDRVWIDKAGSKMAIDGGNVFGGYLHGVHLSDDSDSVHIASVGQDLQIYRQKLHIDKEFNRLITA